MADFIKKPKIMGFPLWAGQDTVLTIKRTVNGEFADYPDGSSAKIVFTPKAGSPVEISATIAGPNAVFVVSDELTASVITGWSWRLQFTISGRKKSPVLGKAERIQ